MLLNYAFLSATDIQLRILNEKKWKLLIPPPLRSIVVLLFAFSFVLICIHFPSRYPPLLSSSFLPHPLHPPPPPTDPPPLPPASFLLLSFFTPTDPLPPPPPPPPPLPRTCEISLRQRQIRVKINNRCLWCVSFFIFHFIITFRRGKKEKKKSEQKNIFFPPFDGSIQSICLSKVFFWGRCEAFN